jgi:tetratricopeptide (TPR) repeat protein
MKYYFALSFTFICRSASSTTKIKFLAIFLIFSSLSSCGLFDSPATTTSGFDEVLNKAPFKGITDSISKAPQDAALLFKRAELLSQNNQHDIAYYDYKKSWEISPNEATAIYYSSNLFLTARNKEAVNLLKSCIEKYPTNPDFKRRLGEAYIQAGQRNEALTLYDDILKADSANFEALYEKGMLYSQLKDTFNAIATLEKSFGIQPVLQNGLALANMYAETKNSKVLALCDFLQKKDTAREFVDPVFLKGLYYSNTKQYDKALAEFEVCVMRDYRFIQAYIEKGIIHYEQKNYKLAMDNLNYATEINFADPDVYFWKGRCMEAQNKTEEALDNYYKALSFDRGFTEAKEAIKRLKK